MPHTVADRRSVAAGGDVNVGDGNRVALRDYHEHHHYGLRGQPPKSDACCYCGHELGTTRDRDMRIRHALKDARRMFGYSFVLLLISMLSEWRYGTDSTDIYVLAIVGGSLLLTVVTSDVTVQAWRVVVVWLIQDIPRLCRWLAGSEPPNNH